VALSGDEARPNARVLVDEDGVINVYLSPKVMYDKEAFLKVQEGILGIYHPRCCPPQSLR
jgi:hypothetical protein